MTVMCISAIVAALLVGLAAGLAIGVRIGRHHQNQPEIPNNSYDSDKSDLSDLSEKSATSELSEISASRVVAPCGALVPEGEVSAADKALVEQLISYIEEHMRSPQLSVEELSEHFNMSRVHLYRKVKAATGRTPIDLIRVIRLRRASRLLKDSRNGVADVAALVGFNTPRIFSRYFREEYGVLPSEFNAQFITHNSELP